MMNHGLTDLERSVLEKLLAGEHRVLAALREQLACCRVLSVSLPDELLGFPGRRVPDGPTTPGRDKVVWEPSQGVKITTYEQHPYHLSAPDWHRDPHWHLDTPGQSHQRHLPGDPIPGY
jgi:hypothetical protein